MQNPESKSGLRENSIQCRTSRRIVTLVSQPLKHVNARSREREVLRLLVDSTNEMRRPWWALYLSVRADREALSRQRGRR